MPTNFGMPKKKPLQNKKLHIVWFVDSAKTNTFSISQKLLWALGTAAIAFVGAFGGLVWHSSKQSNKIDAQSAYIQELKSSIVESYLQTESAATPYPEEPALPSAAIKPASTPVSSAPPHTNASTPVKTGETKSGAVELNGFSLTQEPNSQKIVAKIVLTNTKPNVTLAGITCAVFHLKNGTQKIAPSYGLEKDGKCAKGIPVKFARIRPTEFEISEALAQVQSVEVRFASNDNLVQAKNSFVVSK